MPEVPMCIHCRKAIDRDAEDYVVTNKDEVRYESQWLYAHAKCHDEKTDEAHGR